MFKYVLPRNLTWNLKMMVSKRNFLFWGLLFRFHVKFLGCNPTSKRFANISSFQDRQYLQSIEMARLRTMEQQQDRRRASCVPVAGGKTWDSDNVHPGKLTRNLKITCLKRKTIFQTFTFGFHVNFQGCRFLMKSLINGYKMGRWDWIFMHDTRK